MPSALARAACVRPRSSRKRRSRTPTRAFVTTITPCPGDLNALPDHRGLAHIVPARRPLAQVPRALGLLIGLDHRSSSSQVLQNRELSATNLHTCRSTTLLGFQYMLLR